MATQATQYAVPAPINASFTSGEFAVGLGAAPGSPATRFFSRNFSADRSGLYLFKLWVRDGGTIRIGRNLAGLAALLTAPANQVIVTQLYLEKGVNRIDIETVASSAACFAMTLYHPGALFYTSRSQGWVFNPTVILDIDVPPAADAVLPVFSILPNWKDGVLERISYLTDIPTSETMVEQPRLLRMHPRRSVEAQFLRSGEQRARLDAFLSGIGLKIFWVPLWHEQFRPTADLGPASAYTQFPAGTLAQREFMVGDQVMASAGDPETFEVLTVESADYDLDRLYWLTTPTQDWGATARIIPLRRARILEQTTLSAPTAGVGRVGLRFELVDPEYRFGASWGSEAPVWGFKVNRATDISFVHSRNFYTKDSDVGPVDITEPADKPRVSMQSSVLLRGRADTVRFRRFIDMAAGRAGRFYMPTLMRDLEPVGATVGGTTLDCALCGFTDYSNTVKAARSIIAFEFNDASPTIYRRLLNAVRVGGVERLTLDEALPSTPTSSLRRVQFMVPSRFDQDSFELNHLVDSSAAIQTSVVTRSVDGEDMAEIAP